MMPRKASISNVSVTAIWAAIIVAAFWILPRLYEPTYISVDPIDSRSIYYHRKQWFGPTIETKLEARFDRELNSWVWMSKRADGSYWRFFRESD